jgi:hypothetical protein
VSGDRIVNATSYDARVQYAKCINNRERKFKKFEADYRKRAVEHARQQGADLQAARDLCRPREWRRWCEENLELGHTQIKNYLKLNESAVTGDVLEDFNNWQHIQGNLPPADDEPDNTPQEMSQDNEPDRKPEELSQDAVEDRLRKARSWAQTEVNRWLNALPEEVLIFLGETVLDCPLNVLWAQAVSTVQPAAALYFEITENTPVDGMIQRMEQTITDRGLATEQAEWVRQAVKSYLRGVPEDSDAAA